MDIIANLGQTNLHTIKLWHHILDHISYLRHHKLLVQKMVHGIPYILIYKKVGRYCQKKKQS